MDYSALSTVDPEVPNPGFSTSQRLGSVVEMCRFLTNFIHLADFQQLSMLHESKSVLVLEIL